MNRFTIPILPFVSVAVTVFSVNTVKSATKKLSLLVLATLFFSVKTFSQTSGDESLKVDSCFLAVKIDPKTQRTYMSKTFCIGYKVTIRLKDDKIHGRISKLSRNNIVIADNEIDVSKIKWIKKSKLTASRAIVGGLLTVTGLALVPASQEADSFEQTGVVFLTGAALVPIGIVVFVSRTKFRMKRGDKLIFEKSSIADNIRMYTENSSR